MKKNSRFDNIPSDFWANTSLINQRLGYANKKLIGKFPGGFFIPSEKEIAELYRSEGLNSEHLLSNSKFTEYGELVIEYFEYRADVLTNYVEKMLMDVHRARKVYLSEYTSQKFTCPLPTNNQGKAKGAPRYLNCLINMVAEKHLGSTRIDYDPKEMTAFTIDGVPQRSMTRRVDGAVPGVINPVAIWEIKEYYYTTTFGSKISDGIYATQLDGHELNEIHSSFGVDVEHIMFVDGHFTWWNTGRSYLCRMIDILHMDLVDELMFGCEVVTEWPGTIARIGGKLKD